MNKFKKNTSKDPVGPSALMLLEDGGLFRRKGQKFVNGAGEGRCGEGGGGVMCFCAGFCLKNTFLKTCNIIFDHRLEFVCKNLADNGA